MSLWICAACSGCAQVSVRVVCAACDPRTGSLFRQHRVVCQCGLYVYSVACTGHTRWCVSAVCAPQDSWVGSLPQGDGSGMGRTAKAFEEEEFQSYRCARGTVLYGESIRSTMQILLLLYGSSCQSFLLCCHSTAVQTLNLAFLMSCHAMPHCAMLCCAVPCRAVLCCMVRPQLFRVIACFCRADC